MSANLVLVLDLDLDLDGIRRDRPLAWLWMRPSWSQRQPLDRLVQDQVQVQVQEEVKPIDRGLSISPHRVHH